MANKLLDAGGGTWVDGLTNSIWGGAIFGPSTNTAELDGASGNLAIDGTMVVAGFDSTAASSTISGAADVESTGNLVTAVGSDLITNTGTWTMSGTGNLKIRKVDELEITGAATMTGNVFTLLLSGDGTLDINGNNLNFDQFTTSPCSFTGVITADNTATVLFVFTTNVAQPTALDFDEAFLSFRSSNDTFTATADISAGDVLLRGVGAADVVTMDMNSGANWTCNALQFGRDAQGDGATLLCGSGTVTGESIAIGAGNSGTNTLTMETATLIFSGNIDLDGITATNDAAGNVVTCANFTFGSGSLTLNGDIDITITGGGVFDIEVAGGDFDAQGNKLTVDGDMDLVVGGGGTFVADGGVEHQGTSGLIPPTGIITSTYTVPLGSAITSTAASLNCHGFAVAGSYTGGDVAILTQGNDYLTITGTFDQDIIIADDASRTNSGIVTSAGDITYRSNTNDITWTQSGALTCVDLTIESITNNKMSILLMSGAALSSGDIVLGKTAGAPGGPGRLEIGADSEVGAISSLHADSELDLASHTLTISGTLDGTDINIELDSNFSATIRGDGLPTIQNVGQGGGSISNDINAVDCVDGGSNDAKVHFVTGGVGNRMRMGIGL